MKAHLLNILYMIHFYVRHNYSEITEIRGETSIRSHKRIDNVGYENNKNIR